MKRLNITSTKVVHSVRNTHLSVLEKRRGLTDWVSDCENEWVRVEELLSLHSYVFPQHLLANLESRIKWIIKVTII